VIGGFESIPIEFWPFKLKVTGMKTEPVLAMPHVWLDDRGVAWVDQTNTKVIEIVQDMLAHGWSPEEIHFQHPHLGMAQIHAAIAFYYDHQADLDAQIASSFQRYQQARNESLISPLRQRLLAVGKIV
jgi:uncharacterized protein (DUF433 family)